MPKDQIVVNGRFLAKSIGGVARVGRELLRELIAQHADIVVALPPGAETALSELGLVKTVRGYASQRGEQALLPFAGETILSFCNTTPLLARRSILWIHDAHVFDAPDSYSLQFRLLYKAMLRGATLRGFDIVTVSNFSRERLMARGAKNVTVVPNGGDHLLRASPDDSVLAPLGGAPFVAVMGSPAKHKNMDLALRALCASLEPNIRIVAVGLHQSGPYAQEGGAFGDRVTTLPPLSDGQLRAVYRDARAIVVPSKLEGFGLYAAEALFEDAPLALSDIGAHREVAGSAALYFDPNDARKLAECVNEILRRDRSSFAQASQTQRGSLTWARAARQTLDLIARARSA